MTRKEQILDCARRDGRVHVETLASELSVSVHTIRRDINALCAESRLRRVHGGAEYIDDHVNLSYPARALMSTAEKRQIARVVATQVPDGATLFISIGTTPALCAQALRHRRNLTVVTNNLNAANALAATVSNRIILPGGVLRLPDRDLIGPEAIAIFDKYRADVAIYGVGGIDEDGTLLDFHEAEVQAREAMRANARSALLVADASKFGRRAAATGGTLNEADCFVTDRRPEPPFAALLDQTPGRVMVAGESADD